MFYPFQLGTGRAVEQMLIEKWQNYLTEVLSFHLVSSGEASLDSDLKRLSNEDAAIIVQQFVQADRAWIGTRHHEPVWFHFAVKIADEAPQRAILTNYIDIMNDDIPRRLAQMIEILNYSGNKELQIPFPAPELHELYKVLRLNNGTSLIGQRDSEK